MRGFSYCQSQSSGFEVVIDAAGFVCHATHISNLLAQSPVVAAIRARKTIDGFGMTEACFTPVNAIEIGKQAVLGLQRVGLDSVNARLFREVELPTISLVEIDACSYTSNEDEIAKHSRLHSNQEHDHEDHEVGPRFDVFEVDHSGLRATFASNRLRLDAEVIRESANLGIAGVAFTVLDTQNGVVCEAG